MADPLRNIKIAPRALRDLKRLDRQTLKRVQQAFQALEGDAANLDIKAVAGHTPWRRLRVGEYRVLYRELAD
jgi:mRNA-degrading endonuclease RelE of RelBE toxin-antitoxin system